MNEHNAIHNDYADYNKDKKDKKDKWQRWGPYLSERAWGTVREDYSATGEAWEFFPHDHARSRAYRWNEDGLAGISDDKQYLCFALALWNHNDPILKERLFGLTGNQGNHGEDVKEYYFYLDNTPTHSYMKMLYKYPQAAYPYGELVAENARRGFDEFEYELLDTGVFAEDRYFDVLIEYAKADANDILIRISATNHGPDKAPLTLLPQAWFRNTWAWGYDAGPMGDVPTKPHLQAVDISEKVRAVRMDHPAFGDQPFYLYADNADRLIFTENETNAKRIFGGENPSLYVKDAFHETIVNGNVYTINPEQTGTKSAAVFHLILAPGQTQTVQLRLCDTQRKAPFRGIDKIWNGRIAEADAFYDSIHPAGLSDDEKRVQRQALAGMLWTKQLYYYDVDQWLDGDPIGQPPHSRKDGRNHEWRHLNNYDVISMPDKWEYPWYAGWDLAFHCIPLAMLDVDFAKAQLITLTREWYMHPNGQLPAYEWAFADVNPPVHAWAAWRVYELDDKRDQTFLKRVFNKMLLNFTWWVNRKDADDNNVFQGGFLGLDNISIFDRSASLPTGGRLDQSDGTSWMGFYSLTMMNIALELAADDDAYEDMAIKFFEHFLQIAAAMSDEAHLGTGLWDEQDGFFYDVLRLPGGRAEPLRVRSLVGLMPLIAIETIGHETLEQMPRFRQSVDWMQNNRPQLTGNMLCTFEDDYRAHIISIPTPQRMRSVLRYMLDENEFLSPYGIRSVSKYHEANPFVLHLDGSTFSINYQPAESLSGLFGGNSNWRGPIWFPINYLLIESLRKYYRYYGDDFQVEMPTGSGVMMNLDAVADELSRRLERLFLRDNDGKRAIYGGLEVFQSDPNWRDLLLFHEYFHGDNGAGLGASHQTGWTGLVAALIQQSNGDKKSR
jgi:hypothetical protein